MKLQIIRREAARRDIIEQAEHIGRDNPDAAERFMDAAEAAIKYLGDSPGAGARRKFSSEFLDGLRLWPIRGFEKHLIFYKKVPRGIEIVRVLHAARDIPAVLDSESSES